MIREVLFFFLTFVLQQSCLTIVVSKSIVEGDTKLADPKVFMEAMMSKMRRVMKMKME
jgi:hypothetical protein